MLLFLYMISYSLGYTAVHSHVSKGFTLNGLLCGRHQGRLLSESFLLEICGNSYQDTEAFCHDL